MQWRLLHDVILGTDVCAGIEKDLFDRTLWTPVCRRSYPSRVDVVRERCVVQRRPASFTADVDVCSPSDEDLSGMTLAERESFRLTSTTSGFA